MTRLTDLLIQKLSVPKSGQRTYRDDLLRGFGIRVSQGGSKSFVVMFGLDRRLRTLGKYPGLSLKEARDQARRFMAQREQQEEIGNSSIAIVDAIGAYLVECGHKNRERTVRDYARILKKYLPAQGHLGEITRRSLMEKMTELARVPAEQSHVFTCIKVFFNWCVRQGYLERHPLDGITGIGQVKARERFLDESELRIVLRKALGENSVFANIVALCILTGQRRGEVVQLKWEYVEGGRIHLPAGITKNGREHTIPFGSTTAGILQRIARGSEYLFPGRSTGVFNGWNKSKCAFDPADIAHYRVHDLRRTFASTHARIGTPVHVVEKLLNHVSGTFAGVTGVYNRYDYMPELEVAAQKYETYLSLLCASNS